MSEIIKENKKYQKLADNFVASSGLVDMLKNYGEIEFTGSYPAGLMLHGDLDIRVIRDKPFSVEEVFEIFRDIYIKKIKYKDLI